MAGAGGDERLVAALEHLIDGNDDSTIGRTISESNLSVIDGLAGPLAGHERNA